MQARSGPEKANEERGGVRLTTKDREDGQDQQRRRIGKRWIRIRFVRWTVDRSGQNPYGGRGRVKISLTRI